MGARDGKANQVELPPALKYLEHRVATTRRALSIARGRRIPGEAERKAMRERLQQEQQKAGE